MGGEMAPLPTSYMVYSPLKILTVDACVHDLIDHDCHWWNVSLIKEIFSSEEVKIFLSLPLSTTNQLDIPMWRGTIIGSSTMGSAYHFAKEWESKGQVMSVKYYIFELPNLQLLIHWLCYYLISCASFVVLRVLQAVKGKWQI
jgi:hypothetical protein